jgi:Mn2+/Fe2+ NRAMP family transporter
VVHTGIVLESTQTAAPGTAAAHYDVGLSAPAARGWAFGPGLVHLLGTVGPNDLIFNSIVAATYGYSLLWALLPAYTLHFFIAEASSRYVLTTGESIVEGFARLGRRVMIVLAVAIVFRRHLNNLFPIPLMGQALHMLVPLPSGFSVVIWALISTALSFVLMIKGGYPGIERRARGLVALLTGALVIVALMARPDVGAILAGLLTPTWPGADGVVLLMALAATSVGSINHLKYPAFVFEKGWRDLAVRRQQRIDLVLSCLGQLTIAALIQIAVAATLHGQGAQIRTLSDLAGVFSTHLGEPGRVVFAIGMWATVFSSNIGSNTGYSFIVADVYERLVRRKRRVDESRDEVRRKAYLVFLTIFCVSPLYVLFTDWEPFWIGILAGAIWFALAPLMMLGLLAITSNRALMRDQVNRWFTTLTIGLAIALSLALTYQSLSGLVARLTSRLLS